VVAWNRAQRERPAIVASVGRIASASEPGQPLVVHGRVYRSDGVTPAAGVVVFGYHTDRTGVYNRTGAHGWRLYGWAKSDADGRFEFRTIRPGAYPGRGIPAHIHVTIDAPSLPRRWVDELQFLDDPLLTAEQKRSARPVTTRAGVQNVDFNIRIEEKGRF
jgi:protocatechuate 3,4-dioxygenase beta subunit